MDTLLTIAEAAEKTGRSPSTIRRLIRAITDTPSHPDRPGVKPTPEEVEVLKKQGENFTWKIQEEVLLTQIKGALKEEKKSASSLSGGSADILQILQGELAIKNRQIERQWEVIHALNDRLREGNILMGSLQKRLTLPSPEPRSDSAMDASAVLTSAEAPQKGSRQASSKTTASGKASRRGLMRWFGR